MNRNPAKFERCVNDVKKRGEAANAYAVCTAAATRKTKRNPGEDEEFLAAADASEEFHGTPAKEVIKVESEHFEHDNLADCGELVALGIRSVNGGMVTLKGFEGARLARSPKGFAPQLFIEGGDQSVDLSAFDIEDEHELEELGELKWITYFTDKKHLGKRDGGVANYKHTFGENGGRRPMVVYDTINETLTIVGGQYTILPEGIDN